jgi:hypothetical protein
MSTKKLHAKLTYKKAAHRKLLKLTPDLPYLKLSFYFNLDTTTISNVMSSTILAQIDLLQAVMQMLSIKHPAP